MDILQREIIDERKIRMERLEPTSVGSMGRFCVSLPFPGTRARAPAAARIITTSYDEIIAREFPASPPTLHRRHDTRDTPRVNSFRNRELEWRRANTEMLSSVEGQWVVLEGSEVIAHGEDPVQVINEAKSRGIRTPYIFFVEPRSEGLARIGL